MGADKVDRIPVKVIPTETPLRKPDWIRVRMSASPEVAHIKSILRKNKLASVCEEALTETLFANIAMGLIRSVTDATLVGPFVSGLAQPAHIMIPSISARGIFNLSAVVSVDSQKRKAKCSPAGEGEEGFCESFFTDEYQLDHAILASANR